MLWPFIGVRAPGSGCCVPGSRVSPSGDRSIPTEQPRTSLHHGLEHPHIATGASSPHAAEHPHAGYQDVPSCLSQPHPDTVAPPHSQYKANSSSRACRRPAVTP